jgi:hypothetical protein
MVRLICFGDRRYKGVFSHNLSTGEHPRLRDLVTNTPAKFSFIVTDTPKI